MRNLSILLENEPFPDKKNSTGSDIFQVMLRFQEAQEGLARVRQTKRYLV
jgi:hypothetical protein